MGTELAAAVPKAFEVVLRSFEAWSSDNGWIRRRNIAPFIDNPIERAATNIYGPGTQVAEESVFFNMRQGPDAKPLSGARRYRLRFPPGQIPPVDGFWSLTLYDRNFFLFDNPIDRYGINDRTEGLRYGQDGALEIQIQAAAPQEGSSNWLPAPDTEFELILRTYQPHPVILDRRYTPPPLEIVE
jgi:hypothetical protein